MKKLLLKHNQTNFRPVLCEIYIKKWKKLLFEVDVVYALTITTLVLFSLLNFTIDWIVMGKLNYFFKKKWTTKTVRYLNGNNAFPVDANIMNNLERNRKKGFFQQNSKYLF